MKFNSEQKNIDVRKFSKSIVSYGVVALLLWWIGSLVWVLGSAIFENIWFWVVAVGYIIIVALLWESKDLSEGKKFFVAVLVLIFILLVYQFSRPTSSGRSYLQESCSWCDQW